MGKLNKVIFSITIIFQVDQEKYESTIIKPKLVNWLTLKNLRKRIFGFR